MSLGFEVLILALAMTFFSALPLFSPAARRHSRIHFLIGTGAMFGICFFDLVPDVFQMGGSKSLFVDGGRLVDLFASFHLMGHHHGEEKSNHELHHHVPEAGFALFLVSIVAHCFASGMLLTVSYGLSKEVASTVFAALVAHKIYESLLLSSMILVQKRSTSRSRGGHRDLCGGVARGRVGHWLIPKYDQPGSRRPDQQRRRWDLLGCLIFDFLIPSIGQLRGSASGWGGSSRVLP